VIDEKLAAVDAILQDIYYNQNAVIREITRIAETAIDQARVLAGEKALAVRSAQTELRRKQQEMEAMDRCLLAHRKCSGPLIFLCASDRHSILTAKLQSTSDLPPDFTVQADLTVIGNLEVGCLRGGQRPIRVAAAAEAPPLESLPGCPTNAATAPLPSSSSPIKRRSASGLEITALTLVAQRRDRKNRRKGVDFNITPFQNSEILTDRTDRNMLYRCFPFLGQPLTHLLFSTTRDERSIAKMHQLIDGIGITAVIIQHGDFKFGGFAAEKWNNSGQPFGENSSSFLFSISQDALIPYRPQVSDSCYLYATSDTLTFGRYDLILADDFEQCSAVIENSFGVGFEQGSTDAQTFLAGEPTFRADIVEVWGFFTLDSQ
jgi:hypothetical protein